MIRTVLFYFGLFAALFVFLKNPKSPEVVSEILGTEEGTSIPASPKFHPVPPTPKVEDNFEPREIVDEVTIEAEKEPEESWSDNGVRAVAEHIVNECHISSWKVHDRERPAGSINLPDETMPYYILFNLRYQLSEIIDLLPNKEVTGISVDPTDGASRGNVKVSCRYDYSTFWENQPAKAAKGDLEQD